MKLIDMKSIPETGRNCSFRIDPKEWRSAECEAEGEHFVVEPAGPLDVNADVQRAGRRFVIDGTVKGSLWLCCDRCLNSFRVELDTSFHTFLALHADDITEEDIELNEEDMDVDFVSDGPVDFFGLLRSQILLNLPMKSLCAEDCKGLCGRCGKDLNQGPCDCRATEGHPALKILEELKPRGGQ